MMKYALIIISVSIITLLSLFFYFQNNFKTAEIFIRDKTQVHVLVADTFPKITKGLGGRERMEENEGMIFLLSKPAEIGFWMKGMKFPLDIIWISDEKIIAINKNVDFHDQNTLYSPGALVDKVLEVNAGFSDKNDIKVGDKVEIISK